MSLIGAYQERGLGLSTGRSNAIDFSTVTRANGQRSVTHDCERPNIFVIRIEINISFAISTYSVDLSIRGRTRIKRTITSHRQSRYIKLGGIVQKTARTVRWDLKNLSIVACTNENVARTINSGGPNVGLLRIE